MQKNSSAKNVFDTCALKIAMVIIILIIKTITLTKAKINYLY